jgi:hypothetical protein
VHGGAERRCIRAQRKVSCHGDNPGEEEKYGGGA